MPRSLGLAPFTAQIFLALGVVVLKRVILFTRSTPQIARYLHNCAVFDLVSCIYTSVAGEAIAMLTDGYDNSVDAVSIAYISQIFNNYQTVRTNFLSARASRIYI